MKDLILRKIRLDGEMHEGEICLMCYGVGNELGNPKNPACCWCLGQGIVPSREARRLDPVLRS